jgi:hypothetical protein
MRRALAIGFGALVVLALAAAGVVASWTRTPHGTLDVGAAIVVHSMPSGGDADISPENRARMDGWIGKFCRPPPRASRSATPRTRAKLASSHRVYTRRRRSVPLVV